MIRSAFFCVTCDAPTENPENEYCEHVCSDCLDNAAEAAWDRYQSDYYGGAGPLPLREQQIEALKIKRG